MRVYIDTRDWWVGYYRGANHHYICPLPCLVVRIPRWANSTLQIRHAMTAAVHLPPPHRKAGRAVPITLEELVSDAPAAIAATDWADPRDAFSTQSYLRHLQSTLPASHQLALCEITLEVGELEPVLAVAS